MSKYLSNDQSEIRAIREYIFNLQEPSRLWPKGDFMVASIELWAANDILIYVLSHNDWTVMRSVETYANVMQYAYKNCKDKCNASAQIISISYKVAQDITDILYAMNY